VRAVLDEAGAEQLAQLVLGGDHRDVQPGLVGRGEERRRDAQEALVVHENFGAGGGVVDVVACMVCAERDEQAAPSRHCPMSACQPSSPRSDGKAVVGPPPHGRPHGSGRSPAAAAITGATDDDLLADEFGRP
jgi:hypothetical protein